MQYDTNVIANVIVDRLREYKFEEDLRLVTFGVNACLHLSEWRVLRPSFLLNLFCCCCPLVRVLRVHRERRWLSVTR
jgi:hypothetical protein